LEIDYSKSATYFSNFIKQKKYEYLSSKYTFSLRELAIIDIQRLGVHIIGNPQVPHINNGDQTLIAQYNGFSFTCAIINPTSSIKSPFTLKMSNDNYASVYYCDEPFEIIPIISILYIMDKPSLWYFPFKDEYGRDIDNCIIVNPLLKCQNSCKGCSRLSYHKNMKDGYLDNLDQIIHELSDIGIKHDNVKFINIITGSHIEIPEDFQMFMTIIERLRHEGYNKSKFGVYTSSIQTHDHLLELKELGIEVLTFTVDTLTTKSRNSFFSYETSKRKLNLEEIIELLSKANNLFSHVNSNVLLGFDSTEVIIESLREIKKKTKTAINHFIPRLFNIEQWELLDPTAFNLEYYVQLLDFVQNEINQDNPNSMQSFFQKHLSIPKYKVRYRS